MYRRLVRMLVVPLLLALVAVTPAVAAEALPQALSGTVFLPDGHGPAVAAVVDLVLADGLGNPVPDTAFARAVTDLHGHFTLDPRETSERLAAAQADGGMQVVLQVGDLAPHGSLDTAAAAGSSTPDVSYALADAVLRAQPSGAGDVTALVFETLGIDVNGTVTFVLQLADDATRAASVAGMFTDPDLVAGNDDVNDPDLVPPLGAIMTEIPAVPEVVGFGPVPSDYDAVQVRTEPRSLLRKSDNGGGGSSGSCSRDPGTRWVSAEAGNNIQGTKTYVYLDTYSCTGDRDQQRDEVIFKWGGYTVPADKHWTIYRLKYRTQVEDGYNFHMKYPDPVGDQSASSNPTVTISIGWDFMVYAAVTGSYTFRGKKIHGWQADGTGHLYHVSWISNSRGGTYTENALNNGGGANLDVPEGADGRTGVGNSVIIWRCYYPSGYDGSTPDPDGRVRVTCDD